VSRTPTQDPTGARGPKPRARGLFKGIAGIAGGMAGAAGLAALAFLRVGVAGLAPMQATSCSTGDGGSCSGGPTLEQQCLSVYTTLCAQGARCDIAGLGGPDCASGYVTQYCPCSVEACDASSCETAGMVSNCQQDLETEDCNAIVNFSQASYWPSDCQPFMGQQQ
jgi:hypothetical protein